MSVSQKRPQSHLHKERKYSDIQRDIRYTISCITSGFNLQGDYTYKISYIDNV